MRVIITGGTGLIGSALARKLAQNGDEVIVLSRHPSQHRSDLPRGVTAVEWDAHSSKGWEHLAEGAGAIVNLAGSNIATWPWSESNKRSFLMSRLNAGKAVSEAVEKAQVKPQVVIQSSGIDYYEGRRDDEPVDENTPPGHDFLSNLSVGWEKSTQSVEALGVRRAIIRTGLVLARQSGALPKLALPFRFFVGGPMGSGRQVYSRIHLEDEVRAIRFLIENETASGPFNLTAPNALPEREFADVLGKVLGRPSWLPVPGLPVRLVLGEMAVTVLRGRRVIPEKLLELGFEFKYPDLESALAEIYGSRQGEVLTAESERRT